MGSEWGTQSGRVGPGLALLGVQAAAESPQACRALSRGAGNGQVNGSRAGNPVRVLGLQVGGGHSAPSWARDAGVLSFAETCCHPFGWLFLLGGQLARYGARAWGGGGEGAQCQVRS